MKVDLYLMTGGDVDFVQVHSAEHWEREPGFYGRRCDHEGCRDVYVLLVEDPIIVRHHIDEALTAASRASVHRRRLTGQLQPLQRRGALVTPPPAGDLGG